MNALEPYLEGLIMEDVKMKQTDKEMKRIKMMKMDNEKHEFEWPTNSSWISWFWMLIVIIIICIDDMFIIILGHN